MQEAGGTTKRGGVKGKESEKGTRGPKKDMGTPSLFHAQQPLHFP